MIETPTLKFLCLQWNHHIGPIRSHGCQCCLVSSRRMILQMALDWVKECLLKLKRKLFAFAILLWTRKVGQWVCVSILSWAHSSQQFPCRMVCCVELVTDLVVDLLCFLPTLCLWVGYLLELYSFTWSLPSLSWQT
jgi:hypothetical protein